MPSITFIHADDRQETVDAVEGDSAMLAALTHGVEGIVAECGGGAVCATCHVYVDEAWLDKLPLLDGDQDDLLEGVATERLPTSRLSCQITMTQALDGLVLRVPARQV
jgi:2Fe-2S ferredoxin